MKKKIRLVTVLKIKKHLETLIEETHKDILKYNETDNKIDTLISRALDLSDQLIAIKEIVQKANQGRHLRTGRTNNYYIFKYSNLLATKRLYQGITGVDPEVCQISPDEAKVKIRKIDAELNNISTKLSNFNLKKRVTVEFDSNLELDHLLVE